MRRQRNSDHAIEDEYVGFVLASQPQLLRLAYLMCGDWHRAEDIVQTVLPRCTSAGRGSAVTKGPSRTHAERWSILRSTSGDGLGGGNIRCGSCRTPRDRSAIDGLVGSRRSDVLGGEAASRRRAAVHRRSRHLPDGTDPWDLAGHGQEPSGKRIGGASEATASSGCRHESRRRPMSPHTDGTLMDDFEMIEVLRRVGQEAHSPLGSTSTICSQRVGVRVGIVG